MTYLCFHTTTFLALITLTACPSHQRIITPLRFINGLSPCTLIATDLCFADALFEYHRPAIANATYILYHHLNHHLNDGFTSQQSGFSFKGGRPRCFAFWQEFQKCYASADTPSDCIGAKEDYLECLHHTKEIARAKEIKDHWIQRQAKEAHAAREKGEVRATSSILDLGLINDQNEGGKGKGEDKAGSGSSSGSESS